MGRERTGENTRNALADALLQALNEGETLSKIPIREITDACDLDRQTFYYHFKDIYELAEFMYDREIVRIFDVDRVEDIYELDWKDRVRRLLDLIGQEDSPLRGIMLPTLGEEPVRKALRSLIEEEVRRDIMPSLADLNLKKEEVEKRMSIISYLFETMLMGWLNGEIEDDIPAILDMIEEVIQDYVRGLRLRLLS